MSKDVRRWPRLSGGADRWWSTVGDARSSERAALGDRASRRPVRLAGLGRRGERRRPGRADARRGRAAGHVGEDRWSRGRALGAAGRARGVAGGHRPRQPPATARRGSRRRTRPKRSHPALPGRGGRAPAALRGRARIRPACPHPGGSLGPPCRLARRPGTRGARLGRHGMAVAGESAADSPLHRGHACGHQRRHHGAGAARSRSRPEP